MSSDEEEERERIKKFDADTTDIIAFSVAAWQLFIPLIIALVIVGVIVYAILNLFS